MAQLIPVLSPNDPRVSAYQDVRDRDLGRKHDGFMAEGSVVMERLIRHSPFTVRSVLLAASRVAPLQSVLDCLPDATPVYVAEQHVMDGLVGFPIHRGILAIGDRPPRDRTAADLLAELPHDARRIVLCEGITNHDNIGAIFRNAAALGASAVLMDAHCCDPLYRKAIRVSSGNTLIVPWCRAGTSATLIAASQDAGFTVVALSPHAPAHDMRRWCAAPDRPPKVGVLLGTEGPGLTQAAADACDARLRIPMAPGVDSLNVATAGAVALYALSV